MCGAISDLAYQRAMTAGSSPRVRRDPIPTEVLPCPHGISSACAERSFVCVSSYTALWDHLRVCGAIRRFRHGAADRGGSSPRVRSDPVASTRLPRPRRIISACAERSKLRDSGLDMWEDHLRVCGAIQYLFDDLDQLRGSSPRVRSDPHQPGRGRAGAGIISACAERSVVFYWDLVRLDGAECLIRTLCGVVEWRCSRYLEWMLSIYVTRASRPRIWGVLVVAGFRKSSERSRALTRRVAPRMNVFLSIIGLIDDRDTITLWGRRYPLGAYPKVDGIRLINEATKGGAHVFHCFVAAY